MAKYHMKRCSSQLGFSGGSDGKESACNVGSVGSICGLGRSPGKGNGNRLQCSCLGNSMNRGGWRAIVHGVAKSQTWLSDQHFHFISVIREIQKRHVKKCSTSLIVQFSRVRLCNPMNRNTPGLPVHHQVPEFTQTLVHWVGDAIQPSHPDFIDFGIVNKAEVDVFLELSSFRWSSGCWQFDLRFLCLF